MCVRIVPIALAILSAQLAGCGSLHHASGRFGGDIVEERRFETMSGRPVTAAALSVTSGPELRAMATSATFRAEGKTALLADSHNRILDPSKFRAGDAVNIRGEMILDFGYDQNGEALRLRGTTRYGAPQLFVLRVREVTYQQ
jgi:hypothetical protein